MVDISSDMYNNKLQFELTTNFIGPEMLELKGLPSLDRGRILRHICAYPSVKCDVASNLMAPWCLKTSHQNDNGRLICRLKSAKSILTTVHNCNFEMTFPFFVSKPSKPFHISSQDNTNYCNCCPLCLGPWEQYMPLLQCLLSEQ